jgi:hypothetical protein
MDVLLSISKKNPFYGYYPWSFVTQIFHSGQPSHGDTFPVNPNQFSSIVIAGAIWIARLITGCVTRLTPWLALVEKELFTLPEHLRSSPVFSDNY